MPDRPDWNALYEMAAAQDGYFTTRQAASAGYSRPLLARHLSSGRIVRARRGIYRVVHYPPSDHEDLVVIWLWSDRAGLFSHETALALHDLSDALPAKIHMTVPATWKRRRLQVPASVMLHYAEVESQDRGWVGSVPVTNPRRTLLDCVAERVGPDLVRQAHTQALRRGLLSEELSAVGKYLDDFGGRA